MSHVTYLHAWLSRADRQLAADIAAQADPIALRIAAALEEKAEAAGHPCVTKEEGS